MKNLVEFLNLENFFYFLWVCTLCVNNGEAVESGFKDLIVKNVKRTVDSSSQCVKISTKLTLSNEGHTTLTFFHFVIEDEAFDKVSYIGATYGRTGEERSLRTSLAALENAKGWKVEFDKPLRNGQAVTIDVEVILGDALALYSCEIETKENQLDIYAREPLLLFATFFTIFVITMIITRSNFAISKDKGTEVDLKVASLCEKSQVIG